MEKTFTKVHTGKDLIISTLFIIAGVILFFFNKGVGILLALIGLLMLLVYKAGYRTEGETAVFSKKSLELCKGCRQSVKEYIEGKDIVPEIKEGHEGGSIRLDVYFNKEAEIVYAKLYDFSNYTYEPATETVRIAPPASLKLLDQIV